MRCRGASSHAATYFAETAVSLGPSRRRATHCYSRLQDLPYLAGEFALHELQVVPAMIQTASKLGIDVLCCCCLRTDNRCGGEIPHNLPISRGRIIQTELTIPSRRLTRLSRTFTPFLATVRTSKGSNLAESSSLAITRAMLTPSPGPRTALLDV